MTSTLSPGNRDRLDVSGLTEIEDLADLKSNHKWAYGFAKSKSDAPDWLREALPNSDIRGILIDDLAGTQIWLGSIAPNALDAEWTNLIF